MPDACQGRVADIDYRIVRSPRRRYLELRVYPDLSVEVRAPRRATLAEIAALVVDREAWVRDRQAWYARQPRPPARRYEHGALHPYLGREYPLHILPGRPASVWLSDEALRVVTPAGADASAIQRVLMGWYRQRAYGVFEDAIDRLWAPFGERGHARPVLRVKNMKTRWGSLSQRGYINLNLALVRLPVECIDYVVMHELCHLQYMSHGPRFHGLMDRLMPDWRQREADLRRLARQGLCE